LNGNPAHRIDPALLKGEDLERINLYPSSDALDDRIDAERFRLGDHTTRCSCPVKQ
jgi:hypothetical protein